MDINDAVCTKDNRKESPNDPWKSPKEKARFAVYDKAERKVLIEDCLERLEELKAERAKRTVNLRDIILGTIRRDKKELIARKEKALKAMALLSKMKVPDAELQFEVGNYDVPCLTVTAMDKEDMSFISRMKTLFEKQNVLFEEKLQAGWQGRVRLDGAIHSVPSDDGSPRVVRVRIYGSPTGKCVVVKVKKVVEPSKGYTYFEEQVVCPGGTMPEGAELA